MTIPTKESTKTFDAYFGDFVNKEYSQAEIDDARGDLASAPLKHADMLKKATLSAMLSALAKIMITLKEELKDYQPAMDAAIAILYRSNKEIDRNSDDDGAKEVALAQICREEIDKLIARIQESAVKELADRSKEGAVN